MPTYFLNLRTVFNPFEIPTLPHLLLSLKAAFPREEGMIVVPPRRSEAGMFKVVMGEDNDNLHLPLSVGGQEYNFLLRKLTSAECEGRLNTNPRAECMLYTLYNCTTGGMGNIPNSVFDTAVTPLGRLTRMVEHQRHRGSQFFNGNRFFCMVTSKDKPMPDTITITDPENPDKTYPVRIGYKGKGYTCARCQAHHVGPCPAKEDFYTAQRERAELKVTSMLLADSTLRHADTTGLSADIYCMPGGRIGHLAHLVRDAPQLKSITDVVIVAGTNDITRERESMEEFDRKIEIGVEKMQHNAFSDTRTLTFVGPPAHAGLSPLARRKRDRFTFLMQKLSAVPECKFRFVPCDQALQTEDGHPTEDGTKELLHVIDAAHSIIRNGKFITRPRLYDGVKSVYRYGCLYCHKFRLCNEESYCQACMENKAPDPTFLTAQGDSELVQPVEVHMSERDNKRLSSGEDPVDSTPSKHSKPNDGSSA